MTIFGMTEIPGEINLGKLSKIGLAVYVVAFDDTDLQLNVALA